MKKIYVVQINECYDSWNYSYCETLDIAKRECYEAHKFIAGRIDEEDLRDYTVTSDESENEYYKFLLECKHITRQGHNITVEEIELVSE